MRASRYIVTALSIVLAFTACQEKLSPRAQLATEGPGSAYAPLTDVEQLKEFLRTRFLPYPMMADHLEVVLGAADEIIGASLTRTKAPWYPEDIGMILTRLIEKVGLPGVLETKSQRVAFVLTAVTGLNDYVGNLLPDTCSRVQYSSAMASHLGKVFGSLLLKSRQLEELAPLVYQELILVRGGISPRNCRQSLRYATARSLINGGKAGGLKTAALVTVVSALVKEEIRLARVEGVSTATLSNSLAVWENRVLENNAALSGTEGLVEELRVSFAASASDAAIDVAVATSTSTSSSTPTSTTDPTVTTDAQQIGEFCGGDGVPDSPYKICNLATLKNVANRLEASFIITKDIDASATATSNNGAGWEPIGTTWGPFTGTIDGQNHLIYGLKINSPATNYIGLFGVASATSSIKNIRFTDAGIVGNSYVGIVAGQTRGVIQGVSVQGSVQGTDLVGGILGNLTGAAASIVNSNAQSIAVSGFSHIGGIAGISDSLATITRSWSSGTVTGVGVKNGKVGGIVGRLSEATISYSYSSATISGNNELGGIAGRVFTMASIPCAIEYSHAAGNVTAVNLIGNDEAFGLGVGGLVGTSGNCLQIKKSYATGNVTSNFTSGSVGIGGLVGTVNWGGWTIEDSYATGNVTSSFGSAGGLLGGGSIPISRCYATGAVNAPMDGLAGGLATINRSWVSNSFSTGVVSGATRSGGLVIGSTEVRNSYWLKPAGSPFTCSGGYIGLVGCTEVPDMSFFSQTNNALLSTWDFINVWYIPQPGALPLLRE